MPGGEEKTGSEGELLTSAVNPDISKLLGVEAFGGK
jgi:hypothetical protein